MNADDPVQDPAKPRLGVGPVRERCQERAEFADPVGPDEQPVPPAGFPLLRLELLPPDHEPREIDLVLMRGGVRAMVVAELAVVALIGDLLKVARCQLAQVAVAGVNSLEERVKGRTEIKAPPTTVADLKDAQGLLDDGGTLERRRNKINTLHGSDGMGATRHVRICPRDKSLSTVTTTRITA